MNPNETSIKLGNPMTLPQQLRRIAFMANLSELDAVTLEEAADEIDQLRSILDANSAVKGAYYCGECLQCQASAEIKRLHNLLEQCSKEMRAYRRLYEASQQEKNLWEREARRGV